KDLFYPAERIAELAATFAGLSAASLADPARATARLPASAVEARDFRDAVQLGRKRAIQILEFFDRVGYTRRVGDAHLPRPNTRWGAEGPESEDMSPAP
ncbi:MAG: SelB C-terminal domain-containing protein, partial [Bordetella sp.]|nr:SelB C-terminal domain-containing protein [Bordetella sp.]